MAKRKSQWRNACVFFIFLISIFVLRQFPYSKMARSISSLVLERDVDFTLAEVSASAKVINKYQTLEVSSSLKHIEEYVFGMGASVSVVDYDNDGWQDIFVPNTAQYSKNKLFKNLTNGLYTEVADAVGLANLNIASGSVRGLFFDYDNDGFKDMLLLTSKCPRLFHQENGKFKEVVFSSRSRCGIALAANVIDYDTDGFLDIVIGGYYKSVDLANTRETRIMPNNLRAADNGGSITVYHNEKGAGFEILPSHLGIKSRGWTLAIGSYDLRNSGRSDLWFATDFNTDQVYLNNGTEAFENASNQVKQSSSRNGMSAEVADVDNDGKPMVFVTNIFEPPYAIGGNLLWKSNLDGTFSEISRQREVNQCGWAWGVKFIDLNNDGNLDIVVTNGYRSANPKKSYWYPMSVLDGAAQSIVENAVNWPPIKDMSLSGYQKKCIFLNRGTYFQNVIDSTAYSQNLEDGRALATIDEQNSGSQGFIVANHRQDLRMYRATANPRNKWIGFSLEGTRSNRDAIGTKVKILTKEGQLTRELQPFNGYASQSDARIHFGLGSNPQIQKIEIVWPSGTHQEVSSLALNQYHKIIEPR